MSKIPRSVSLNSGHKIPSVGLGVFLVGRGRDCYNAVSSGLKLGFRHIDTAQYYNNESDVGRAVLDSGVPREQVYITTKVWRSRWGYKATSASIKESLTKLKTPYVDLLLLHSPGDPGMRAETWQALEDAVREGQARSIGVSNFGAPHLEKLAATAKIPPAVNQIEVHPFLQRADLVRYCQANGIVVEAYSPLCKAIKLSHLVVAAVSRSHGVTPAQVLVRWSLQKGLVPLPKSVNPTRQRSNLDVFSFDLTNEDMAQLDALEEGLVTGWDPITQDAV